jgi:hypothetical protein
VASYQVHVVDDHGDIRSMETIEAASDDEACAQASKLLCEVGAVAVEVRQLCRGLIARVEPGSPDGLLTSGLNCGDSATVPAATS